MIDDDYKKFNKILQPLIGEQLIIGKKYCSPIPRDKGGKIHYETSPSFSVYEFKNMLLFKDWGMSTAGHKPEHLVMALHSVDIDTAKAMLDEELPELKIKRQERYNLEIQEHPLTQEEIKWWSQFNVTERTLRKHNCYGVESLYCERRWGKDYLYRYDPLFPCFSYRSGDNWQYYQPEIGTRPKKFWRVGTFIGGWDQLPYTGDTVVIVSGAKDGFVFHEATGIPILWGSGEGAYRQFQPKVKELKRRFKNVFTLFDPDPAGQTATEIFSANRVPKGHPLLIPPIGFKYLDLERDIADLSREYGLDFIKNRIINRIERDRNK